MLNLPGALAFLPGERGVLADCLGKSTRETACATTWTARDFFRFGKNS
jgi:hypothetical protein